MKSLLSEAGRELLKTLAVALLALGIALTQQPNFHGTILVGVAGMIAILAALLKVVSAYVPLLSFKKYLPDPWGAMLDAFVHAGLAAFISSVIGILALQDLSTWKSLLVGAVIGALNAGLTALEHAFTPGLRPDPASGFPPPPATP